MEQDQTAYAPFSRMQTSRDAPNPLRPYYIPPSIGILPDSAEASVNATGGPSIRTSSGSRDFRELFSDIDYGDYLPNNSPGIADMAKKLMDQAIWNYTSIFLAQPFEVAKIVLQCHAADSSTSSSQPSSSQVSRKRYQDGYVDARYEVVGAADEAIEDTRESKVNFEQYVSEEEESDEEAPSYFTSVAPHETPSSPHGTYRRKPPSRSHSATPTPANPHASSYRIELRHNDSISEVISQLWQKESAWGVWKGTNSTFVYNVLLKTIETWTRSFLSAILNLPDPTLISPAAVPSNLGKLNVLDSPSPMASLVVAVASAGVAALILAPLDMVRTRLIITPITSTPRALIPNLRILPSLSIPPSLLPITILHSTIPTFLSTSFPILLRHTFRIDALATPTAYSLSTFTFSIAELFVKLPLETVLRRGHVAALQQAASQPSGSPHRAALPTAEPSGRGRAAAPALRTVVPVGPYKGVLGTAWHVVREEGVAGLWRGWRVGFWGLVGVWGASALGGGGVGGEF